jgi:hypothetical protein
VWIGVEEGPPWSGPLEPDENQAAVLTVGRVSLPRRARGDRVQEQPSAAISRPASWNGRAMIRWRSASLRRTTIPITTSSPPFGALFKGDRGAARTGAAAGPRDGDAEARHGGTGRYQGSCQSQPAQRAVARVSSQRKSMPFLPFLSHVWRWRRTVAGWPGVRVRFAVERMDPPQHGLRPIDRQEAIDPISAGDGAKRRRRRAAKMCGTRSASQPLVSGLADRRPRPAR